MSAFTITPRVGMNGNKIRELFVTSEKYGMDLCLSANRCDIVADDGANKYEWISRSGGDADTYEHASMLLRLRDGAVAIELYLQDLWSASVIVLPVNPEDFKQLLRDAAAMLDKQ